MAKHLDAHGKVQAVIFAEIYGDDASCKRFEVSLRSLQRYRSLVQDKNSELAKIVAEYARIVAPEKAESLHFGGWIQEQVREASTVLLQKAKEADARNPESIRVLNEHVVALLNHAAALEYLSKLFGDEQPGHSEHTAAGPIAPAAWCTGTGDTAQATA